MAEQQRNPNQGQQGNQSSPGFGGQQGNPGQHQQTPGGQHGGSQGTRDDRERTMGSDRPQSGQQGGRSNQGGNRDK